MRCLHVYSGNLFGGVERVLMTLAAEQGDTRGVEHVIALAFDSDLARRLRAAGITPHIFGPVRALNPYTVIRARRSLARIAARLQCDVMICHGAWAHALVGAAASRAGLPVVWWVHGAFNPSHWLDRFAMRRRAQLIVCNSEFTRSTLLPHAESTPVRVIFNPVAASPITRSQREERRRQMGVRRDQIVVAQAGRMERSKGHEVLLRALGRLEHRHDWVLWQVGGPQRPSEVRYLEALQRLASDLGIADRVVFTGSRDDAAEFIAAADVYAQPNISPEGFGLTLIEAMSSGVPVVTSAIGAAAELVDDTCGVLVAPADDAALAAAVDRLLEDDAMRRRLGAGGPPRAQIIADPGARLRELTVTFESVLQVRYVA